MAPALARNEVSELALGSRFCAFFFFFFFFFFDIDVVGDSVAPAIRCSIPGLAFATTLC